MDAFAEGDLVTVEGNLLSEKSSFPLGGALYRAGKITLVEKGSSDGLTE